MVFKNLFPVMVRVVGVLFVAEFAVEELLEDDEHMEVCGILLPISAALIMSGFAYRISGLVNMLGHTLKFCSFANDVSLPFRG